VYSKTGLVIHGPVSNGTPRTLDLLRLSLESDRDPFWRPVYIDDVVSRLSLSQRYFIILYADDILMISPSVTKLQNIVGICERELNFLDMQINVRKSCCMLTGQRYNVKCADILSGDGTPIMWVDSISKFKCSFDNAKRSFCSICKRFV